MEKEIAHFTYVPNIFFSQFDLICRKRFNRLYVSVYQVSGPKPSDDIRKEIDMDGEGEGCQQNKR